MLAEKALFVNVELDKTLHAVSIPAFIRSWGHEALTMPQAMQNIRVSVDSPAVRSSSIVLKHTRLDGQHGAVQSTDCASLWALVQGCIAACATQSEGESHHQLTHDVNTSHLIRVPGATYLECPVLDSRRTSHSSRWHW